MGYMMQHLSSADSMAVRRTSRGARLRCLGAVSALAVAFPTLAQTSPLAALRAKYPQVRTLESEGRVRAVYGTQMTRGQTQREAAASWLSEYGALFGASPLDLDEFRDAQLRTGTRRVYLYKQTMDGLPVIDSSFRLMVVGDSPASVAYASGRIARRPESGLPQPSITPAQAIAAAKAHPRAQGLTIWSEPELVAIYDDVPVGDGIAYPTWRVIGSGGEQEPYSFYVHAVTGDVARIHSNVMHAIDITGTVEGDATPAGPADDPDDFGPDTFTQTASCPNDAETMILPDLFIEACDSSTMALVESTYTEADGTFLLPLSSGTYDVHASLEGPAWEILDGSSVSTGEPIDSMVEEGVKYNQSGVDFAFNQTPTAEVTAFLNAHVQMSRTWRYLDLETDAVPVAPLVVNHLGGTCNGVFRAPGGGGPSTGYIELYPGTSSCASAAYSTFVTHEYGHFVGYHLVGIPGGAGWFAEGFSDTLAHMVFDTPVMFQDLDGCGAHGRDPLSLSITFPWCINFTTCIDVQCMGMLLSVTWLDLLQHMKDLYPTPAQGYAAARTLHLDWIYLAQMPATTPTGCPSPFTYAAADEGTLVEVLLADSPDDDPANAPHLEQICAAFNGRGIGTTNAYCMDSARTRPSADCNEDQALTIADFVCFQDGFMRRAAISDCDRNGEFDILDFVCFHDAFMRGQL